jgi:hypothetical protein
LTRHPPGKTRVLFQSLTQLDENLSGFGFASVRCFCAELPYTIIDFF